MDNNTTQTDNENNNSILSEILLIMKSLAIDVNWHGINCDKEIRRIDELLTKIK